MPNDVAPGPVPRGMAGGAIFGCFLGIGLSSFGGGTTAWMRKELVRKRGWLEERPFLAGLALCQIAPGPNGMNLAVFVGTNLRGMRGAVAALGGLMLPPVVIVMAAGLLYLRAGTLPGVQNVLTGVGAAAVGLMFANGVQIARRAIRSAVPGVLATALAVTIGLLHAPLLPALLVTFLVSWVLARRARRQGRV